MRKKSLYNETNAIYSPGPANYDPNFDFIYKNQEKYSIRPKTATIKPNDHYPGPGQYSIRNDKSDFKKPSYVFGKEQKCKPSDTEMRFNPGPDYYTVNDKPVIIQAPKFSFGKEIRDNQNERAKTPGPGAYQHKETFGFTGPKISMSFVKPLNSMSRAETPGPGQYNSSTANFLKAPQYK